MAGTTPAPVTGPIQPKVPGLFQEYDVAPRTLPTLSRDSKNNVFFKTLNPDRWRQHSIALGQMGDQFGVGTADRNIDVSGGNGDDIIGIGFDTYNYKSGTALKPRGFGLLKDTTARIYGDGGNDVVMVRGDGKTSGNKVDIRGGYGNDGINVSGVSETLIHGGTGGGSIYGGFGRDNVALRDFGTATIADCEVIDVRDGNTLKINPGANLNLTLDPDTNREQINVENVKDVEVVLGGGREEATGKHKWSTLRIAHAATKADVYIKEGNANVTLDDVASFHIEFVKGSSATGFWRSWSGFKETYTLQNIFNRNSTYSSSKGGQILGNPNVDETVRLLGMKLADFCDESRKDSKGNPALRIDQLGAKDQYPGKSNLKLTSDKEIGGKSFNVQYVEHIQFDDAIVDITYQDTPNGRTAGYSIRRVNVR